MNRTMVRNAVVTTISVAILAAALVGNNTLIERQAPAVDAVVQTAIALTGTLVALLVLGRYRRSSDVGDILIFLAVLLLAWVHTLFKVVPDLISPNSVGNGISERIEIWGGSVARILAAWYVLRSTMRIPRSVQSATVATRRYGPIYQPAIASLVALVLLVWLVPVSHGGLEDLVPANELASVLIEFVGALVFFIAGWRLTEKSVRISDSFVGWIAAGCVFGGFAMISSGLFGVKDGDWVQTSDILRMALVFTWAWGAVTEIRQYWSGVSEASWRKAERSVALDLHDGIAQELALISSYLYAPASERETHEWHRRVQATAGRALAEIRRTITTLASEPNLTASPDTSTMADVESEERPEGSNRLVREPIVRMVREAVTNSLRHGGATRVTVDVSNEESPVLRVFDDGVGFDPEAADNHGRLGLVSMQEQADAVGASLSIRSTPGEGTTVEVTWP
jgi:signal transduction histidine kinase